MAEKIGVWCPRCKQTIAWCDTQAEAQQALMEHLNTCGK